MKQLSRILKEVLGNEESGSEDIRSKMDALIQASQEMATRLYQQAAAAQAEEAGAEGDPISDEDDDVVEAEIIEEDE